MTTTQPISTAALLMTLAISTPMAASAQNFDNEVFSAAEIYLDSEVVLDSSDKGSVSNPKGLWFFVGGNTGLVSVGTDYQNEANSDGYQFNFKALGAYYFRSTPWVLDTGIGFQFNRLESHGKNHASNNFNLEITPRYQLTRNWQLGPSSSLIWGKNSEFSEGTSGYSHFVGAALDYEFPLDNEWPVRIGARVYTDTNISKRNVNIALLNFSIGWPVPKRREQAAGPTYNKPIVQQSVIHRSITHQSSDETLVFSHQTLGFSEGRVTPLAKTERFLQNLAQALNDEADLFSSIEIIGHTDSSGSETTNRILSQSRAQKAIEILSQQGISIRKLTAIGIADATPLVSSSNAAFLGANRRIEIQFRGVDDRKRLRQLLKQVAQKSHL